MFTDNHQQDAGTSLETRIQVLKTALPRKYSIHNAAILQSRFTEYQSLLESVGQLNEKMTATLRSNLSKLSQRIANIGKPGNSIAACRHYYNEALTYMTIELINIAQIVTKAAL